MLFLERVLYTDTCLKWLDLTILRTNTPTQHADAHDATHSLFFSFRLLSPLRHESYLHLDTQRWSIHDT